MEGKKVNVDSFTIEGFVKNYLLAVDSYGVRCTINYEGVRYLTNDIKAFMTPKTRRTKCSG